MNKFRFTVLHYVTRLKHIIVFVIAMWIIGYLMSVLFRDGGSKRPLTPGQLDRLQVIYNSTMAKTIEYCNPPHLITASEEGISPVRGGKLEFVAVVTRHGDRNPLRIVRDQLDIPCTPEKNQLFEDYLKEIVPMVPKHTFGGMTLYPKDHKCTEAGMLTWLGAYQLVKLGDQLREAYVKRHGFLEEWTEDNLNIFSTGYPRTYHSAIAFLHGFLRSPNIADIRMLGSSNYKFCFTDNFCYCDLAEVYENLMFSRWARLWKAQPIVVNLMERLSPIVKYHPDQPNFNEPFDMFDSLMGYVCHNHRLPCIPGTDKCVTQHDVHEAVNYILWHRRQIKEIMGSFFIRKYSLLHMQGLLYHLSRKIASGVSGREPTKFALFSGHDMTVEGLLDTFGVENVFLVPYASRLIFEVYSFSRGREKEFAFRAVYNGVDITGRLSFCSRVFAEEYRRTDPAGYGVCLLDDFDNFVETALHDLGDVSFQEACNPTF